MAKYYELTAQQKAALEPLFSSEKSLERKIEKLNRRKIVELDMDYERTQIINNQISSLKTRVLAIKKQINDIYNAKETFDKKYDECEEMITDLESMKKQWGFTR